MLDGENFDDLLSFASGFSNLADVNKITLSSIADNGERIFKNYRSDQVNDLNLADGDEIFVHRLSNTPRNIIEIIGEIASPGSIAYEDNITLEKLIKPESFLEGTYPFYYHRKKITA